MYRVKFFHTKRSSLFEYDCLSELNYFDEKVVKSCSTYDNLSKDDVLCLLSNNLFYIDSGIDKIVISGDDVIDDVLV